MPNTRCFGVDMALVDIGIVATQASDEDETVATLQKLAGGISDLTARGIAVVRKNMARKY